MASAFSVSESILRQACFFDQIEAKSSEHVASRASSETQQLLVLQAQGVDLKNLTSLYLMRARNMWWSKFRTFVKYERSLYWRKDCMKKGRLYNDHGLVLKCEPWISTLKALIDCSLAGGRALLKMSWAENVGHRSTSDHSFRTATTTHPSLLSVGQLDRSELVPYSYSSSPE